MKRQIPAGQSCTRSRKRNSWSHPAFSFFLLATICFFSFCHSPQKKTAGEEDIYYTCSMDPQVIEAQPGNCPICHMSLTAARKSTRKNDDELQLSPQQVRLGNILTDTVSKNRLGSELVLTGVLNVDQLRTTAISARVAGRIEKLFFRNPGEYIKPGARLFALYSESLNNAREEYRLMVEKHLELGNGMVDYRSLIQSARNKLLLWGLTEDQVQLLDQGIDPGPFADYYSQTGGFISELPVKEGDYVGEGTTIFRLADLSAVWAEAQVYSTQLSRLNPAAQAVVKIPDIPGREFSGRIEFVNPEINPATRINLVRVVIPNKDLRLKPGMPVYVILKNPPSKTISLPADAVLRSGDMESVWVESGPHRYISRMVETGLEANGMIEIRSGLLPGDIVVVQGAYLLQSEYVFRKGSLPMAGHHMGHQGM